MADLWMPGATRLDSGDYGVMDGGPAKAIAHITWDRNATRAKPLPLVPFTNLVDWFGRNPDGKRAAPHLLWNPWTGQVVQFLPATSRSKSLADQAGGTRTNRAGSVVIQIEAWFFPWCVGPDGRTYERLADTPCKGWAELNAWVRSHGVPDTWPMGRPTDFTARRNETTWRTKGGWYAHAHVPENDHQDPGSWPTFTTVPEDDMQLDERLPASHALTQADAVAAADPGLAGYRPVVADALLAGVRAEVNTKALRRSIDLLSTKVDTRPPVQVDAAAVAAALTANAGFIDTLANALATKLSKRLES